MKKLIALMLVGSFTGAVIAQQTAPQNSAQAKPAAQTTAKSEPTTGDKDKKKHHHHHHRHHDKPGDVKK